MTDCGEARRLRRAMRPAPRSARFGRAAALGGTIFGSHRGFAKLRGIQGPPPELRRAAQT